MFGLNEMSVNAIEHGNLGITYEEKKKLIVDSSWKDEVAKRLSMKENKDKYATLIFSHNKDCYEIRIKDMGMGFEHEKDRRSSRWFMNSYSYNIYLLLLIFGPRGGCFFPSNGIPGRPKISFH